MNLYRLYGWKIGGGRCEEAVPFNKGINRSALGAFSLPSPQNPTGMWALWQKLGAWNRICFEAFLSEAILPRVPQGSVLVLDNARIHHGQQLNQMVERAGCSLLYLPPYSPDFNPIELVWSWIKGQVRDISPRDDIAREQAIEDVQQKLPSEPANGWFRKCGIA